MNNLITIDWQNAKEFISEAEINAYKPFVKDVHKIIAEKSGQGSDYLGWHDYPEKILENASEITKIEECVNKLKDEVDVLLVVGIGGSYLGARAVIESLSHHFYNNKKDFRNGYPEIYYIGQNMSAYYIKDLFDFMRDKKVAVNVISKSGTTTEPAIAFRLILQKMKKNYSDKELKNRIFATTSDSSKSALKNMADDLGLTTFFIPDDIGGRYSVFTPVGLFPICAAGIDISSFLKGAVDMQHVLSNEDLSANVAHLYSVIRNINLSKGKSVELLASFHQRMFYILEWWKQLFGESEGKNKKGIFPSSAIYSTDLHSLGQYMQDGMRILQETFLEIENIKYPSCQIPKAENDLDNLNYLVGKDIDYINAKASQGTQKAHRDGSCPNINLNLKELSVYSVGALLYFFMKACASSGYLNAVNPFNQPGVEFYKKNMFDLLGKP